MSQNKAASWVYTEQLHTEPESVTQARKEAAELQISSTGAASVQFLKNLVLLPHIRTVAEIGTGTGVVSLSLLLENPAINLTTIDIESVAQGYAREHFAAAGIRPSRYRIINGLSSDLLPRLACAAYDLVYLDGDPLEAEGDAKEAIRMLRPGGILVCNHALYQDRVADPARRDNVTVALRNLGRVLLEAEELSATVLPVGDGLIFAVKR